MLRKTYTTEINTERLLLRRFEKSDAASVHRNWASDPEVQINYGEPVYETVEKVTELLEKYINRYSEPNYYRWTVFTHF